MHRPALVSVLLLSTLLGSASAAFDTDYVIKDVARPLYSVSH